MQNDDYLKSIFKTLDDNELIGVAVIKAGKIVLSTKGFAKIINYTPEELKNKDLSKIFDSEFEKSIEETIQKKENKTYRNIKLKTKGNLPKIANVFIDTINGGLSNLSIMHLTDITREAIFNNFRKMLSSINQAIIHNSTKDALFEDICRRLIENEYIDLIWVVSIEDNKADMIAYSGSSRYAEYALDAVNSSLLTDKTAPIYKSLVNEKIVLSNYVPDDKKMGVYKTELMKEGFLSVCYIPIKENSQYRYAVNLYSKTPFFFDDYIMPILKEIQNDIHFSIANIHELFYKRLFSEAIQNTKDWVLATDAEGNIIYANEAVSDISGYQQDEIIGKKPSLFKSDQYDDEFYKALWDTILLGKVYRGIIVNKAKNGEHYQLYHTIVPIVDRGSVNYFIAMSKDTSREMYLEEQVRKFRYYDTLTDMLNAEGFIKDAEELIAKLKDTPLLKCILVVDIYDFSHINKIYGVRTGDRLLKEIGHKLIGTGRIIGRLGDDEFVILSLEKDKQNLESTILKIFDIFSKPIEIDNQDISIGINIGVSILKNKQDSLRSIITNATNASKEAKRQGKNRFKIFDNALNNIIHKDFQTENLIFQSLSNHYFTFYLQPIYSAKSDNIIEFESLARIIHPKKGLIAPSVFIDYLEKSYYLLDFEKYLIQNISDYLRKIKKETGEYVPIGINLSMRNLTAGKTVELLEGVDNELLPYLTLEVTERIFSDNIDNSKEVLETLKEMGFRIMIDDFGTGYSSLSYIHTLPIDAIKIDISFVKNMMKIDKVKKIVRSIIDMSKALDIQTVAEGVETKEQLMLLKQFGCDFMQGYLFSKPIPFGEALRLLK